MLLALDFYTGQDVKQNFYYGFHQLTEVALKALSPGVNDPGTAVLSVHALADLFEYRIRHHPESQFGNNDGKVLLYLANRSFKQLFAECIYAIWDYGSEDRFVQNAFSHIITQLLDAGPDQVAEAVLKEMLEKVKNKQSISFGRNS